MFSSSSERNRMFPKWRVWGRVRAREEKVRGGAWERGFAFYYVFCGDQVETWCIVLSREVMSKMGAMANGTMDKKWSVGSVTFPD